MNKRQIALFAVLILSGITLGLLLQLDILGFVLSVIVAISIGLWIIYDLEDRDGKNAKGI